MADARLEVDMKCECGVTKEIKSMNRIIGGKAAGVCPFTFGDFLFTRPWNTHGSQSLQTLMAVIRETAPPPWSVLLRFVFLLTSNIAAQIANKWAVTASHCFYNIKTGTQVRFASNLSVVLGVTEISSTTEKFRWVVCCVSGTSLVCRKVIKVSKIIIHPKFTPAPGGYPNDIALLKLAESVDLHTYPPACLPAQGTNFAGERGWVYGDIGFFFSSFDMLTSSGWGATREGGENSATLQELEVLVQLSL